MTESLNREPDGSPEIPPRPGGGPATAVLERPARPDYLKLSPTQIKALLACPAEYWYRYVENLDSRTTPAFLAFGKAIHAAIAAAYARQKTPMTPEEVADVAEHYLRVADKNGIAYKEGDALDDHVEMKKSRKKGAPEEPVTVPGLVTQARRLVTIWWFQYRDDVLAAVDPVCEVPLTYALDGETEITCRVDVAEYNDGRLCLGDHKTAKGWGATQEREASLSTQMLITCWLWWKVRGVVADRFYFTVLKKTKDPEVFRHWLPTPTLDELVDFEDLLHGYASIARHHKRLGRPVRAVQQKCGWCSFAPLCWDVDGAREMYVDRNERRRLEGKAEAAVDDLDEVDAEE